MDLSLICNKSLGQDFWAGRRVGGSGFHSALKSGALDNRANRLIKSATLIMGDNGDRELPTSNSSPSSDTEELAFTDSEAVERRVWRNIFVVIILAVIAAVVLADLRFILGIILGGGLALLNYKWLHASLRGIMAVGSDKTPPGTTMKFVLRWLIIAAVAWAANETGYFDAVAILAGLFAPAMAVMIEAAYVTFKTLAQHNGDR